VTKDNKSFTNIHEFLGGQVVLYQRRNLKNPKFQARLKIPKTKGYQIFSTKTNDLSQARAFAEQKFYELMAAVQTGTPIRKTQKLEIAIKKYLTMYEVKAPSPKRYLDTKCALERYFLKFFGNNNVSEITTSTFNNYTDWRLTNYERKKPSSTYLRKEVFAIRRFYNWCVDQNFADELKKPIELPKEKLKRRPHFTQKEYEKLYVEMRKWVKEGKTKLGGYKWRDRFVLQKYILIMFNTGMRVGEARTLRWCDVDTDSKTEDGKTTQYVYLTVTGKTGKREITCFNSETVINCLNDISEQRMKELGGKFPKKTEPIFCHPDGKPITSFKTAFTNLLRRIDLEYNEDGEKRTLYSIRHSYATMRIDNEVPLHDLSKNLGTSISMLEKYYYHAIARSRSKELTKTKVQRTHREGELSLKCLSFQ